MFDDASHYSGDISILEYIRYAATGLMNTLLYELLNVVFCSREQNVKSLAQRTQCTIDVNGICICSFSCICINKKHQLLHWNLMLLKLILRTFCPLTFWKFKKSLYESVRASQLPYNIFTKDFNIANSRRSYTRGFFHWTWGLKVSMWLNNECQWRMRINNLLMHGVVARANLTL